ncbi:actin maturation protease [Hetaerina americana]|uniref:actin maturation protease n=1 Tax=Hetaerina americana TaxID=62018 RepID=UPI003A7F5BA9
MSQSSNNNRICLPLFISIPIPPPPLFVIAAGRINACNIVGEPKCQKIEDDMKDFVFKIIAELTIADRAFVFKYKYLMPVLQDGPNCGLAALSMVTSCKKEIIKLEDIFDYAKSKGFSNNGEMFSVHYMAEIAQALIGCDVKILEDGIRNKEIIIDEILSGGLLLIPYDADFNHSPCKKKGHRAHWAVVCGLILEGMPPAESLEQDDSIKGNCIQYLPGERKFTIKQMSKAFVPDKLFMLARQGKSLHPAVWKYDDLKDSNENLVEFDPTKAASEMNYIIPPEGVEGGLKGKALILKGLPSTTVDELGNYVKILKNLVELESI